MFDETTLFESASPAAVAFTIALYVSILAVGTVTAVVLVFRLSSDRAPWASRIAELRRRPWTWRDGGWILLLLGVLVGLTVFTGAFTAPDDHVRLLIIESLGIHGLGFCGIALYMSWRGYTWSQALGLSRGGARPMLTAGLAAYAGAYPLVFVSSLVYQGILSSRGCPPQLQDVVLLLTGDHPLWLQVYLVVLAVGVAPFVEELVFRGIFLPLLCRRFGAGAGVFGVSLLFAIIHFHVPSIVPLFVIAVGFSLAYIYTGSLWAPVAMHALFNGVNLGVMMLLRHSGNGG